MSAPRTTTGPITKDMRVLDVITLCPEAESIMAEYGLHCFHCSANAYETLIDGCATHGFTEEDVSELVDDINQLIRDLPMTSEELTITEPAALAIRSIAEQEGRLGEGLSIVVDGKGGFCMEFRPEPDAGDRVFSNTAVPDVRIFTSVLTLKRIGGSTIDFREGTFKLDLAENKASDCACGGNCRCSV